MHINPSAARTAYFKQISNQIKATEIDRIACGSYSVNQIIQLEKCLFLIYLQKIIVFMV